MLFAGRFLLEFEDLEEVERVLKRGVRCVENRVLLLKKWRPNSGFFRVGAHVSQGWVKVVGMPLHLWNCEVFKKIGGCYEGFVAMDLDTKHFL